MKTSGSEIRCAACGNSGHMDEFGFLHPSADEDIIPRTVPEWVDLERDAIRRALASGGFCISAGATLLFLEREGSNKLIDVGHGEMTLDRRAITYRGTRSGEQVSLEFPLDTFVKFPFSMGRKVTFDIPNPERYISIRPDEPEATLKFVLAAPIIKEML